MGTDSSSAWSSHKILSSAKVPHSISELIPLCRLHELLVFISILYLIEHGSNFRKKNHSACHSEGNLIALGYFNHSKATNFFSDLSAVASS